MGRHETLTSWALGRGPYDEDIIETEGPENGQQYSARGHPKNPETKRREKEMVQAANEVMQVTGVVEDSRAAKAKMKASNDDRLEETFTGLRFMEVGRPLLVAGVWGVLGLRRRILLYKPYSRLGLVDILKHEMNVKSVPSIMFSGIPTVLAYHISDYLSFVVQLSIEGIFEDMYNDSDSNWTAEYIKSIISISFDVIFCYLTLHYRWFSILQQLNLVPGSSLLPPLSFFKKASRFQLPPISPLNLTAITSWGASLIPVMSPLLVVYLTGRIKHFISRSLYRPIYKFLPRPTGESMFNGRPFNGSRQNSNIPEQVEVATEVYTPVRTEDEQTLRALEGYPAADQEERERREEERMRLLSLAMERAEAGEVSEDEIEEPTATLISFDVEATEPIGDTAGTWSAELRSANDPQPSNEIKYRVTGLTMLPTILATEGLRELAAGVLTMPLEAIMVRVIARSYAEIEAPMFYEVFEFRSLLPVVENIFGAVAIQFIFAGAIWAGYTYAVQRYTTKKILQDDEDKENIPDT